MKLKQMMFMKIFIKIKICLILVIISKIQKFLILSIKKVIGKMKDEGKETIIGEFVGLKSKLYSVVIVNNEEIIKEKGVIKDIVKNIRHKEYVHLLFNK